MKEKSLESFAIAMMREMKKNGIEAEKNGDGLLLDPDNFPDSVAKGENIALDTGKLLKKLTKEFPELKLDGSGDEYKKDRKLVAKAAVKAIKKFIKKLQKGLEPENPEKELNRYVRKKTGKAVEKALEKRKGAEGAGDEGDVSDNQVLVPTPSKEKEKEDPEEVERYQTVQQQIRPEEEDEEEEKDEDRDEDEEYIM